MTLHVPSQGKRPGVGRPPDARRALRRPDDPRASHAVRRFILPVSPSLSAVIATGLVAVASLGYGAAVLADLDRSPVTASVASCMQEVETSSKGGDSVITYCNLLLPDGSLAERVEVPAPKPEGAPVDVRVDDGEVSSAELLRDRLLFAVPGLLILAVGVVSLPFLLVWGRTGGRRGTAMKQLAEREGWEYRLQDDTWASRWTGEPFRHFMTRRAHSRNVLLGTDPAGRRLVVFDYLKLVEGPGWCKHTVCALEVDRPPRGFPPQDASTLPWRDAPPPQLLLPDASAGYPADVSVRVDGEHALAVSSGPLSPEQVPDVVRLLGEP
jgi:hypothetical protein